MLIQGNNFSLWWDIDRQELKNLDFSGRVEWLENRTERVLIDPLNELANLTNKAFVWMAVTELVCAGINSLAYFCGGSFCQFVDKFMDKDFSKVAKNKEGEDQSYCEHLWKYFRNCLDHGFYIEWGGIWHHDEGGTQGYLRPTADNEGIAIDPRTLLKDFCEAKNKYFAELKQEGENSKIGKKFTKAFEAILKRKKR
jgi:hypothetical protein